MYLCLIGAAKKKIHFKLKENTYLNRG